MMMMRPALAICVVSLLALASLPGPTAAAASGELPAVEYVVLRPPPVGSNIREKAIEFASVPINRRFDELTETERAAVRSWFDRLPAADDPP